MYGYEVPTKHQITNATLRTQRKVHSRPPKTPLYRVQTIEASGSSNDKAGGRNIIAESGLQRLDLLPDGSDFCGQHLRPLPPVRWHLWVRRPWC